MNKRNLNITFQILGGIGVLVICLGLLYTFNLSFREQILTIYYTISPGTTSYQSEILSCNDSGKDLDYFKRGIVSVNYKNGITDLYGDNCEGSFTNEYYCEFNNLNVKKYECEAGCFEGACITPSEEEGVLNENISLRCHSYRITSPLNAVAQNEFSYYSALNAIDGDLTTHWFGDPAHRYPKWIYFDFGNPVCVTNIDLYAFVQDTPISGNIQASNDAIRWSTILSNVTIKNVSLTIDLPQIVTARYIRWFETSSNRSYGSLTDARFRISDAY